jgi:hypothetical protein
VNVSLQISTNFQGAPAPDLPPAIAPIGAAIAAGKKLVHKAVASQAHDHTPETQPYWEYLERQNRRHDVRPDLDPAARSDERDGVLAYRPRTGCRPCDTTATPPARPGYAMPRLGEVLASTDVKNEVRISVITEREHLSMRGRIIDAMA